MPRNLRFGAARRRSAATACGPHLRRFACAAQRPRRIAADGVTAGKSVVVACAALRPSAASLYGGREARAAIDTLCVPGKRVPTIGSGLRLSGIVPRAGLFALRAAHRRTQGETGAPPR